MARDQIHTQNKAKRDGYHSSDRGIGSVEGYGASQNMRRERGAQITRDQSTYTFVVANRDRFLWVASYPVALNMYDLCEQKSYFALRQIGLLVAEQLPCQSGIFMLHWASIELSKLL